MPEDGDKKRSQCAFEQMNKMTNVGQSKKASKQVKQGIMIKEKRRNENNKETSNKKRWERNKLIEGLIQTTWLGGWGRLKEKVL